MGTCRLTQCIKFYPEPKIPDVDIALLKAFRDKYTCNCDYAEWMTDKGAGQEAFKKEYELIVEMFKKYMHIPKEFNQSVVHRGSPYGYYSSHDNNHLYFPEGKRPSIKIGKLGEIKKLADNFGLGIFPIKYAVGIYDIMNSYGLGYKEQQSIVEFTQWVDELEKLGNPVKLYTLCPYDFYLLGKEVMLEGAYPKYLSNSLYNQAMVNEAMLPTMSMLMHEINDIRKALDIQRDDIDAEMSKLSLATDKNKAAAKTALLAIEGVASCIPGAIAYSFDKASRNCCYTMEIDDAIRNQGFGACTKVVEPKQSNYCPKKTKVPRKVDYDLQPANASKPRITEASIIFAITDIEQFDKDDKLVMIGGCMGPSYSEEKLRTDGHTIYRCKNKLDSNGVR